MNACGFSRYVYGKENMFWFLLFIDDKNNKQKVHVSSQFTNHNEDQRTQNLNVTTHVTNTHN